MLSDDSDEVTELPFTWQDAVALGVFTGPQIQMLAQHLGGIPDRKITKEEYERVKEALDG